MSIFDTPDRGPYEQVPEGKHTAVLYSVVDLGTHEDTYQGVTRLKHEIYVCWELVDTQMSDGRPFVIGKTYTVTNGNFGLYFASTSNIHKMLRGWTGLDEKSCKRPALLGKLIREQFPASITIEHQQGKNDPAKTYSVIDSIKPYKGKDKPRRSNEVKVYEVGGEGLADLPEWQQKRIKECLELNGGVPKRDTDELPRTEINQTTGEEQELPF